MKVKSSKKEEEERERERALPLTIAFKSSVILIARQLYTVESKTCQNGNIITTDDDDDDGGGGSGTKGRRDAAAAAAAAADLKSQGDTQVASSNMLEYAKRMVTSDAGVSPAALSIQTRRRRCISDKVWWKIFGD